MNKHLIIIVAALGLLLPAGGQFRDNRWEKRLPDGRTRGEAVLEADHKDSLEDATELLKLAKELKREIKKNDTHVLSVESIRKAEEIEKLAKKIRKRLQRY